MGVVEEVAAEGVAPRQAAEFCEKLVAVHIVVPGGGHGTLEGQGVFFVLAGSRHALDAAELCEGVDSVRL